MASKKSPGYTRNVPVLGLLPAMYRILYRRIGGEGRELWKRRLSPENSILATMGIKREYLRDVTGKRDQRKTI
jgi:hypothetical protein